ncbi:MAG: hypothetical protein ABT940_05925, partial [Alphaproteobacteria bacterium]
EARLLSLLAAVGEPVGNADWSRLQGGTGSRASEMPPVATWHALTEAAREGRVGETALLAVSLLADRPPGAVDPVVLHQAIAALRLVGLETEGRALALEAALADGL